MRKAATIRDVARDAGVSVAVVSRVLNEGSGPVAAATREKVLGAIDRLHYQPRAAARELQGAGSTTLGLVLADLTNPFFARIADRVVWEARARGTNVVLLTTQEDPRLEAESIDALISRSVGSVIATPTTGNPQRWLDLQERGIHVVFVDREIAEVPSVDVVTITYADSAAVATRHLLDLGHERIALISGPVETSTGRTRRDGFVSAMAAAGRAIDEELIHAIPFRGEAGGGAVTTLMALDRPPTALVVANTAQVRSALHRLQQIGARIPDDISVIVFDDNPWTELVSPPLTVVRQPIDMLALHSVEIAVARVRGQLVDAPQRVDVSAEFVRRSSTGAPRPD